MQFLKNHIEKLILAVALLGLMAVAGLLAFRVGQLQKTSDVNLRKGKQVPTLDTRIYDELVIQAGRPLRWNNVRRMFTAVQSVWATDPKTGLAVLIPMGAIPEKPIGDIEDIAWLKKYGLPNVPGVAGQDPDGDGFTNLEEYQYKTDPTDPKSFPQPSDYVVYAAPVQQKFFLRFLGYIKSGDGTYTFEINVNDFDYTYFVKLGQQIASGSRKENYFVDKFEFDQKEEYDPTTNSKRWKEVSRLFIHRGDDPTPITLTYQQVAQDLLPRALLRNDLEKNSRGKGMLRVAKGENFSARGKTYKVVDIKEGAVIISDTSTQQEYVIKPPRSGE
jgi:hypothetical protein